MFSIGKKIELLRKNKKLTRDELAEKVNISKQSIFNYETERRLIPIDALSLIADFFEVPIESFFNDNFINSEKIKNNNTVKIPVIPIAYSDMTNIPSVIDWYVFPVSLSKNADYATIQDNNSMEPKIYEDDLILIKKTNELENENIGLFKLNGKIICKRFYKNLITNEILLKSDNLTVDSIKITEKDNFKIVGKVVGIFDYNL